MCQRPSQLKRMLLRTICINRRCKHALPPILFTSSNSSDFQILPKYAMDIERRAKVQKAR